MFPGLSQKPLLQKPLSQKPLSPYQFDNHGTQLTNRNGFRFALCFRST
jgi:hypothetical protein